jgi:formate dehydrogenase subunit beta
LIAVEKPAFYSDKEMGERLNQQISDKAKELLQRGTVECVIGYERATDGSSARPYFVYHPEEVDRLIFDQTCTHNLVKYLLNKKDKTTAVVVKPCDSKALNLLLNEKQIQREKVFIIGVVCPGIVETKWNQVSQTLQGRCQVCRQHTPLVYDFLVGQPREEEPPAEAYADVAEIEAKPVAERQAFWSEQFSHCIRCYACRQVCPGCYCSECFVEQLQPSWVGIKIASPENNIWQTIRAFHLAGRCSGCNECERVCPVDIPLSLLNRKLEKEVWQLFEFQAGLSAEAVPPFATFKKEETLGIGE